MYMSAALPVEMHAGLQTLRPELDYSGDSGGWKRARPRLLVTFVIRSNF